MSLLVERMDRVESAAGVFLVGADHEAHYSVKRPGLDIFRLARRSFVR